MNFFGNPVGRKIVMAVSGAGMAVFAVLHLLGNSALYAGPSVMNTYAHALQSMPPLMWPVRVTMLVLAAAHIVYGVQITLENRAAKPDRYAVRSHVAATFAGRTMIWSGTLIALFIVLHLLHFTFQSLDPSTAARAHPDATGRPDVFGMVLAGFRKLPFSLSYLVAVAFLGLHLSHSIQSSFQTLSLQGERTAPAIRKTGVAAALLIFMGYAAFPILIYLGVIR